MCGKFLYFAFSLYNLSTSPYSVICILISVNEAECVNWRKSWIVKFAKGVLERIVTLINSVLDISKDWTVRCSLRDHLTREPRHWHIFLIFWTVDTGKIIHKFLQLLQDSVTDLHSMLPLNIFVVLQLSTDLFLRGLKL